MKPLPHTLLAALLATALALAAIGCNDEETSLGANLPDPNTVYNGQHDTLYADLAYSYRDTALSTAGLDYNIVGSVSDPVFGIASSVIFTQIALPSRTSTINFDSVVIDSVVLSLVKHELYPDTNATYEMRFEVKQLAEALVGTDSLYNDASTLPVDESHTFFDEFVSVGPNDTVIRLRLSGDINSAIDYTGDNEGFVAHSKGLRIRISDYSGERAMLTINFAATKTRLTAFYHYATQADTNQFDFSLGTHFSHFSHSYAGSNLGADSIDGSTLLYLEPLAGYAVRVGFDSALSAFNEAHPRAVIHYAELLLPLADGDYGVKPDMLLVPDMPLVQYSISGGDGTYQADKNAYRLRLTQRVQQTLRAGKDEGTSLVINSRRSSAAHTVLNGRSAANPVRLAIIYTE